MRKALFLLIIIASVACKKQSIEPQQEEGTCNLSGFWPGWEVEMLDFPERRKQHAVSFPTAEIGYTAGNYGTIMKTTDGGDNWETLHSGEHTNPPTKLGLRDIEFIGEMYGFATAPKDSHGFGDEINAGALLMRTRDGGQNWEKTYYPEVRNINALAFFDAQNGIGIFQYEALADTLSPIFRVGKTSNAGIDWDYTELPFRAYKLDIKDDRIFLMESWGGENVWHSDDQGDNWTALTLPVTGYTQIHFVNKSLGFIASGKGDYRTQDGGISWQAIEIPGDDLSLIHFENEQEGFLINAIYETDWDLIYISGVESYQTVDGGDTWTKIGDFDHCIVSGINDFTDEGRGYIMGNGDLFRFSKN